MCVKNILVLLKLQYLRLRVVSGKNIEDGFMAIALDFLQHRTISNVDAFAFCHFE